MEHNQLAFSFFFLLLLISMLCLCMFWEGPNRSGACGGGMSWVLVVNCSEMAYRMNKLEKIIRLLWASNFCYFKQTQSLSLVVCKGLWSGSGEKNSLSFMCSLISSHLYYLNSPHSAPPFNAPIQFSSIILADNGTHYYYPFSTKYVCYTASATQNDSLKNCMTALSIIYGGESTRFRTIWAFAIRHH